MVDQMEVDGEIAENEYEYDDESDDENLTLGFVKQPEQNESVLSHKFPSKFGGLPVWLDQVNLPTGRSCRCDFCGRSMQFLLQVNTEKLFQKESVYHRTLYVFICTSFKCLVKHQLKQQNPSVRMTSRSVKVFRFQLPYLNPSNKDGSVSVKPSAFGAPSNAPWPEKEIIFIKAGEVKSESDSDQSDQTEDESVSDNDSSQIEEDIDSFVPNDGLDDALTNAFMEAVEWGKSNNEKSWDAFVERVSKGKAAEQVLRYCRSSKPVWARPSECPSKTDIPKCGHCCGDLTYEFQVMPQMLNLFGAEKDLDPSDLDAIGDSIDWETIVVYTCETSCNGGPSYKEEIAWVQVDNEEVSL